MTALNGASSTPFRLVSAQERDNIRTIINYAEAQELPDGSGLDLSLYFTLTDAAGAPVTDKEISSATILLDDGKRYPAEVSKPDSPIYIVLLLDASGSMTRARTDMQQAAVQAVTNAPENAFFAVYSFSDADKIINLTEGFTLDKNRAINAIGQVNPVNQNGTCLYDATVEAIQLLADTTGAAEGQGRRAVVLFTDGVDEVLQGGPCSSNTYEDVVALANDEDFRVPVFTIGLRGSQGNPINETELRNMAESTGGLPAIGGQEDLNALFQRIIDALSSQWRANAVVMPDIGPGTATLILTFADDTFPEPDVAAFFSPQQYQQPTAEPPTATATFTPIPAPQLSDIEIDEAGEQFIINTDTRSTDEIAAEYRFDFYDANALKIFEYNLPAPLEDQVSLPIGDLPSGEYRVVLRVLDSSGQIVSQADYTFGYTAPPTSTPSPTNTLAPVDVRLNTVEVDPESLQLRLNLSYQNPEQINSIQITVRDTRSRLLVPGYEYDGQPVEEWTFGIEDLPAGDYIISLTARGENGELISEHTQRFSHTPPPTETPTPTVTLTPTITPSPTTSPTATFTPLVIQAELQNPDIDQANKQIVIEVNTKNQTFIDRYELEFFNEANRLVEAVTFDVPPYDEVRVDFSELAGGDYTVKLKALAQNGDVVDESEIRFRFRLPPTPTESPTDRPTVTPTPIPTAVGQATAEEDGEEDGQDNQWFLLLLGIIALVALLAFVIWLLTYRQRREEQPPGDATIAVSAFDDNIDPDMTNYVPQALVPSASFTVQESLDREKVGREFFITNVPFEIGRKSTSGSRDLSFNNDKNVSRLHAVITYNDTTNSFYIEDKDSRLGTVVDHQKIPPDTPIPLRDKMVMVLGTTTTLMFNRTDPDRTNMEIEEYD
jgi:VWFA-related protein